MRQNFAHTFSMQVQVLKKKTLKEEGRQAVYVEQNHRAQLFYTVEDRVLMEEAWVLTAAHREDLAVRPGVLQTPAVLDGPTVIDLLQRERE